MDYDGIMLKNGQLGASVCVYVCVCVSVHVCAWVEMGDVIYLMWV